MREILYSKFDKNIIHTLPKVVFPGKIIVVQTENEAEKAVDYLLSRDILGVDTETRPNFHKGEMRKVALLQVSDETKCFLFRLNLTGMTDAIIRLLENTKVPMIGLSLHDDMQSLHKRVEFKPGNFIDIQHIVGELGIEDLSLQKLYANLFHQNINKRQRLSNWENEALNDKQKDYAAIDAWACINLYREINRLKNTRDYELVKVVEPEKLIEKDDEQ